MNNIQQHIDRIRQKINDKSRQLSQFKKENERLNELLSSSKAHQAVLEEELRGLREQNNILKAATGNMSAPEKAAFEKSINRYIKDIDKCISLLSQ